MAFFLIASKTEKTGAISYHMVRRLWRSIVIGAIHRPNAIGLIDVNVNLLLRMALHPKKHLDADEARRREGD
jgi:hypothetical protein